MAKVRDRMKIAVCGEIAKQALKCAQPRQSRGTVWAAKKSPKFAIPD
jgi:hypothetical protein